MYLPLKQVLHRPNLAVQMRKWPIEISKFDIFFKPRKELKTQVLEDFLVKIMQANNTWIMVTYGSSKNRLSGSTSYGRVKSG